MKIEGFLRAVGPWCVASIVIWNSENWDWFRFNSLRYCFCKFGWGIAISLLFPPNFASEKFPVQWQVKAKTPDSAACFDKNTNPS